MQQLNLSIRHRWAVVGLAMVLGALVAVDPVMAQVLAPVEKSVNILNVTLAAVGVAIVSIAWMIGGYRWLFQGLAFRDVSNLFAGGAVVGGAPIIAAMFF